MWILFCVVLYFSSEGATKHLTKKSLHLQMSKKEIQHYLGASDHSQVPEYDVVSPFRLNDDGEFVSFNLRRGERQRRSLNELNRPNYKLTAFGKDLHLKLVRNERLMAPGLQFEERLSNGRVSRSPVRENTFYLGHVASDPDSLVAVSNGHGLRGLIRHKGDSMFIQPLPDHLARHFRTKRGAHPHLIYKESASTISKIDEKAFVGSVDAHTNFPRTRTARDTSHSVGSGYKFMDAGMIADNLAADNYGAEEIENHLLLLANIVAGMFLSRGAGETKILLEVKKVAVVHRDNLGVSAAENDGKTLLKALEEYLAENSESDDVDVYAFIARGAFGGLAKAGSMCTAAKDRGLISGDYGLQSAGVVAHEMGHKMRLGHDDGSDARCPSNTFIMAATLPAGTKAHMWSPCSREGLQAFLHDPSSKCLDKPGIADNKGNPETLPGEVVSGDQQCKQQYGSDSSHCGQLQHSCGTLWCTDGNACVSQQAPALDGTSCGDRSWCVRGECVDNGFPYADGGWSEWSDFVPCTMECGGGVTYRERTCTNPPPQNGGDICTGSSTGHFKICNPESCPEEEKSYREKECERWNPSAVPVYLESEPCKLSCKRPDDAKRTGLGVVKDGARCTPFSQEFDVCINGKCEAVGCDHQLASGVRNDVCGVCAGNGARCSNYSGVFTENVKTGQTVDVVKLPVGTTHALIEEMVETPNSMGIMNSEGSYLIDPTFRGSAVTQLAGTKVTLTSSKRRVKTRIFIVGPTNQELTIVYWRGPYEQNPGITYSMYRPLTSGEPDNQGSYDWKVPSDDVWSSCSSGCAGGTQTREVFCQRSDDGSRVGDRWCSGSKPDSERQCNTQPCEAEWHLSRWGECSKMCGRGFQTRTLMCRRKVQYLGYQGVLEDLCAKSAKPDVTELERNCREINCSPVWRSFDWSECSTSCDPGLMVRAVVCIQTLETGQDMAVPDTLCHSHTKPTSQKICNTDRKCAPSQTKCPKDHLCQNGAKCIKDPAGYKCQCPEGFQGYFCETQIDPCDKGPCLNGAVCVHDNSDLLKYTCQCPAGYEGRKCEVRINPCDSSPCSNGICIPDVALVLEYSCKCPAGYSGEHCEVPPSYEVGCFKDSAEKSCLESVLLGEVNNPDGDPQTAINSCRKLAFGTYGTFAFGKRSKCFGIRNAPPGECQKRQRVTAAKGCTANSKKDVMVYSFDSPTQPTSLGCYNAKSGKKKALNEILADLSAAVSDSASGKKIAEQCAFVARAWRYDYFAVVNKGFCVSSKDAANDFDKYGEIKDDVQDYCSDGVGLSNSAMEVYRVEASA